MRTAKLFRNGNSQAVRLPKEFAFEGDEVRIEKVGDKVILSPNKRSWEPLWSTCGKVTPDFMGEGRVQGEQQEREDF